MAAQIKQFPRAAQQRRLLPALRRAVDLERDPRRRLRLQAELCTLLADLVDSTLPTERAAEKVEVIELASDLVPRLEGFAKAEVLAARGRMLRHRGELDASLLDIEAALELVPALNVLFLARARTLRDLGRHEEAVRDALTYTESQPESSLRAVETAFHDALPERIHALEQGGGS